MVQTIELSDDLVDRLKGHSADDETIEEFIQELVTIYEQQSRFRAEEP